MTTSEVSVMRVFIVLVINGEKLVLIERSGMRYSAPCELSRDLSQPQAYDFFRGWFKDRFNNRIWASFRRYPIGPESLRVEETATFENGTNIHRGTLIISKTPLAKRIKEFAEMAHSQMCIIQHETLDVFKNKMNPGDYGFVRSEIFKLPAL